LAAWQLFVKVDEAFTVGMPYIKAALENYDRAEPVQPLNDRVRLTANLNAMLKYFITTKVLCCTPRRTAADDKKMAC
jgi:hypothetical protein